MKRITIIIILLSLLAITNAQTDENIMLDSAAIQKHELIVTPELTEMLVVQFKTEPIESFYRFGITNKSQLANLQLGKPVPVYWLDNDVDTLMFTGWRVPLIYEKKIIFFVNVKPIDKGKYRYTEWGLGTMFGENISRYEREDLFGFVRVRMLPMGFYYIRKENKDVFVQVYDHSTRKYFKNEYSLSEIINLRNRAIELWDSKNIKDKQEVFRYFSNDENDIFDTNFPQKHELKMTQEITEMIVNEFYWDYINRTDEYLSDFGITNRAQLENLQLGKPAPKYVIDNDNEKLIFTGVWQVPVMTNGEPLYRLYVIEGDGCYIYSGARTGEAKLLYNYMHKDLIIGIIDVSFPGVFYPKTYLIIRKEHKDIFVRVRDEITGEYFVEYSFSDIINLIKK